MRRLKYLCMSLLFLLTALMINSRAAFAAETAEYTYTVRLYAGNIGTLTSGGVEVSSASAHITSGKDCVTVSGLKYGDTVYITPQDSVSVTDERYYVRGVRRSGRDNSEAESPAFRVASDRDYVVAYGVSGDMVAYTVNYQDMEGSTLRESDTYYGNIGERQYVSSRYIEGYQPQTLNQVKTLSSNEAENVFTFRYQSMEGTETPDSATTTPAGDAGADAAANAADAGAGTGTDAAANAADAGTGTGADAAAGAADAGAAAEEVLDGDTPLGGDAAPVEVVSDEAVPLGQQDLEDLDDDEVPLAELKAEQAGLMGYFPIYLGIGITAALMLLAAGIYLNRRRKKAVAVKPKDILNSRAGRPKK